MKLMVLSDFASTSEVEYGIIRGILAEKYKDWYIVPQSYKNFQQDEPSNEPIDRVKVVFIDRIKVYTKEGFKISVWDTKKQRFRTLFHTLINC